MDRPNLQQEKSHHPRECEGREDHLIRGPYKKNPYLVEGQVPGFSTPRSYEERCTVGLYTEY